VKRSFLFVGKKGGIRKSGGPLLEEVVELDGVCGQRIDTLKHPSSMCLL
jgi:hypothetical protein